MKLAILGGGGVRMPAFVRAVLTHRPGTFDEIRLCEPDPVRRETICALAAGLAGSLGRPGAVRVTADAEDALTGVDYAFSAIRVGGDRGRVIDEQVALARGIVGQETTGAGGCAMALRTIPVVLAYCDTLSRCSPGATLINFTNPAGLITQAISAQGKVPVVGVCDTPATAVARLADFLRTEPGPGRWPLSGTYAGLNHLGWICALEMGGEDRMGELLARFEQLQGFDHRFAAFDPALVRHVGAIPTEYVYYFYDPRRYLDAIARAGASRGAEVARLNEKLLAAVGSALSAGDLPGAWAVYDALMGVRRDTYMRTDMRDAGAGQEGRAEAQDGAAAVIDGYEALALRVIDGLTGASPGEVIVNIAAGGALGLERGDVVEIPARVEAGGISPLAVPRLPRSAQGLLAQVKEYERTTIEAAVAGDADLAAVGLAQHPLVPGITAARELIGAYRELHGPHLAHLR